MIHADKSARLRVVIPRIEVIQPRLRIVVIAPVPERVELAEGIGERSCDRERCAPRIVAVRHHLRACAVQNPDDVPLHVFQVVVRCAVVVEPQHIIAESF